MHTGPEHRFDSADVDGFANLSSAHDVARETEP